MAGLVRIAVIGLGEMGYGHARGFDALDDVEIVALCDTNERGRQDGLAHVKRTTPRVFENYHDVLALREVDAVVIAVPDYAHKEVAVAAARAGKDIFLEKPIATTLADCNTILEEVEKAGCILQIGLVLRYSNLFRTMAGIAHSRRLGEVKYMWCKELRGCFPQRHWFYRQELCGGTLVEKDCHHFDLFNWMMRARATRVCAFGGQHVYKFGEPCRIDCYGCPYPVQTFDDVNTVDHAVVIVEYDNGARASLNLCMYLRPYNMMPEGLEVGALGTNGAQMISKRDATLDVYGPDEKTAESIPIPPDHYSMGHIGCQRERVEFLECVRTRKPAFADGRVGRDSIVIALAAEKSIQSGRVVEIEEIEEEARKARPAARPRRPVAEKRSPSKKRTPVRKKPARRRR